ncbi:hypothetical protein PTTW11_05423 [Pyrenophora teres f. teres]|uniref:Dimer-Tnp-hAT domain containing protein n=1 Tax=Pyrenophora teres f. teres TaxID=97479 RepID=A0A6S6W3F9_9PLEO|nr:hypothetical protein PTTW11_05423 [Pyrenophora teres f. teres]
MSTPSNSGLRRLVECDKRNSPLPSLSNAPTVGDTASEAQADEPLAVQADFPNDGDDDDDDNYNGLDFKRVPYLERRQVERNSRGGLKSWIYRHGWAVWHRKYKKNYWLCRYCHQRRKQEACYEADSTTNAGRHLLSNKPGHSHGPNGPVLIASREGNIMGALVKSQYAFTGLCVYYLNSEGKLVDYLLGLPELHGAHTGNNIAAAAIIILRLFGVNNARVREVWLYLIWGKDRSAYENEAAHLEEEEKYMDEWRKYGPVGVLFDVIASICTPQTRQLLERLQCEEAESLGVTPYIRQLVKPVKTRWNSYFNTFVRAAELHGPIDGYIECKLEEHSAATATSRRRKNREQLPAAQPRLYIREGGLSGKDWATITEYIRLLKPFAEATRLLEGRGRHGRYGAIWEVLVTFEWLLDQLEALKDRLKDVNYKDLDAPKDYLIINVNLAHYKLAKYYAKFDNAPIYYTTTILHPHYKHHLSALWKVPDTYVTARDGVHYRDGWLDNNHRAFLRMWQGRKDSAATSAHTVTPPPAADYERTFSELGDMLGTRRLHMKPELISALQSLKSWKRLGIQPTTTSASGLARTLSEEEISKVQEHLSQFDVR